MTESAQIRHGWAASIPDVGRAPRIIDRQLVYHAGSRGSNRGPIAWDDHDFMSLFGEIGRASRRHHWSVLAWCLMPNHYHLVLRMPKGGFSQGFHQINGNHSRRTSRRYDRTAHLFTNRPWAKEAATPAYVVGAVAYVLRNPVSAGLCTFAHEWRWSSYRAAMGLEKAPSWLALDELLPLLGSRREESRAGLAELVHHGHLRVSDTGP